MADDELDLDIRIRSLGQSVWSEGGLTDVTCNQSACYGTCLCGTGSPSCAVSCYPTCGSSCECVQTDSCPRDHTCGDSCNDGTCFC